MWKFCRQRKVGKATLGHKNIMYQSTEAWKKQMGLEISKALSMDRIEVGWELSDERWGRSWTEKSFVCQSNEPRYYSMEIREQMEHFKNGRIVIGCFYLLGSDNVETGICKDNL